MNLLKLKTTLEDHLPESLQILNVIILSIADDGINRTVFVNDNFNTENVAVMVMDRSTLQCSHLLKAKKTLKRFF